MADKTIGELTDGEVPADSAKFEWENAAGSASFRSILDDIAQATAFSSRYAAAGGSVDTSGTPVATDFARFTDANTIEGREPSEVRTDLDLNTYYVAVGSKPSDLAADVATSQSGTTYQVDADDDLTTIVFTNSSEVTVTIPTDGTDDLRDGYRCLLFAAGAGGLTLSTSGVTLLGSSPNTSIAQNEGLYLEKTATANTWLIVGGTAA